MKVITFVLLWTIAAATIQSIAHRCSMIIQPPGETDSWELFLNELNQNCFQYYNVKVGANELSELAYKYNTVINASKSYTEAYTQNERLLYKIQSWINMVISEPLSSAQRQLKECNSQLLVNTFNLDDMQNTLPIFIKGQDYMNTCFANARERIQEMKNDIELDCGEQITEARIAASELHKTYEDLTESQFSLAAMQPVIQQNIVDIYLNDTQENSI